MTRSAMLEVLKADYIRTARAKGISESAVILKHALRNALAPVITAASIAVLDLLESSGQLRETLTFNSDYFRQGLTAAGFDLIPGEHPIIPVMLGDAVLAQKMAARLLAEGIYVIGFSFPVVPRGQARIRTQMSAGHTKEHLDRALAAFIKVGRELEVIP